MLMCYPRLTILHAYFLLMFLLPLLITQIIILKVQEHLNYTNIEGLTLDALHVFFRVLVFI